MQEPKRVLKKIIKIVITLHVIFLIVLSFSFKKKPSKKIYMGKALRENFRTIERPRPVVKKPAQKKIIAAQKPSPPKKTVSKKPTPKKEEKEVKVAKSKPFPKIEPMKESKEIELPEIVLPPSISQLSIEVNQDVDELEDSPVSAPYSGYIKSIIEEELGLKAGTFVDFELTLNSEGKVLKVKHIESSDVFSRDFIIENIKHMQFADFFGELTAETEYTFSIRTTGSKL